MNELEYDNGGDDGEECLPAGNEELLPAERADDSQPFRDCPTCQGSGWFRTDAGAHPCKCEVEAEVFHLACAVGVPRWAAKARLDALDVTEPQHLRAKALGMQLLDAIATNQTMNGLFFIGKEGSGKTLFASAIVRAVIRRGRGARMITATNFINRIHSTMQKNEHGQVYETVQSIQEELQNVRLLCVDDFGAEKQSDYNAQQWFELFNGRINQGRPTIITSNARLRTTEERQAFLDRIGPRLMSRLQTFDVVEFPVKDFRRRAVESSKGVAA